MYRQTVHEETIHQAVGTLPGHRAVTRRSVALCLALLPINAYWVVQMEMVRYSAHPTIISLFFNVVFILLVLTLLNRWIERLAPRCALSRAELLFLYSVLAVGSCLCGHQMYQILVPMLSWPFRHQDASNQWGGLFVKYLPQWAMMSDKSVLQGYYVGNDTLYRWAYLRAWLPVVLIWAGFTGTMVFVMLCINAILRKQWTENERLTYPVIQIPLHITNPQSFMPRTGLFYNRLFWLGFAIAVGMDTVNSLNVYFPAIPAVLTPGRGQSYYNLADFWTTKPWNAVGWTAIAFYPFVIGMGMLMPLDFLFSCWFFFIFWKFEKITSVALAWDADGRFPYENNQAFGAYMVFWFNRAYHPHPMPHQLEGFKLAQQCRTDYRRWFWGQAILGWVSAFVAFWAILHLMYHYGAEAKSAMTFGSEPYTRLEGWLNSPKYGSFPATMAIAVGFCSALFLMFMRTRFAWWPFHPLAYAVSSSYGMALIWLPLFIAWVLKVIILRYGGRRGFQNALPFFLGLIIGQFVIGSALNILGIVFQIPTYQFFL